MMNSTKQLTITALAAAFVLSGIAAAADDKSTAAGSRPAAGKHRDPEAIFKRIDADADGKITAEEFKKAGERLRERAARAKPEARAGKGQGGGRIFERLDTNKDGAISLEEFKKIGELRAQAGRAPRTPSGGIRRRRCEKTRAGGKEAGAGQVARPPVFNHSVRGGGSGPFWTSGPMAEIASRVR